MLPQKRLGYWFNEKKSKKLSINDLEEAIRMVNIEPVKIDLSTNLITQGPFDGILHKLTDVISQADAENSEAIALMSNLKEYIRLNPQIVMIDPLESIRILTDRSKTYNTVENCAFETKRDPGDVVFIPPFVTLQSECLEENIKLLHMSKVTFPLVCKPVVAHGPKAHEMTLVFCENGLLDCSFPCVAQSFVNHNAVIYKIFAIGQRIFVIERPSITNLFMPKDFPSIHFHSGDIAKANSSIQKRKTEFGLRIHHCLDEYTEIQPNQETLHSISNSIGKAFGVGLFGVDVVIDSSTGHYAIVDINVFPAYSGVDNFPEILADYVRAKLDHQEQL